MTACRRTERAMNGAGEPPLSQEAVAAILLANHGRVLNELTAHTNLPREAAVDLAWRICKTLVTT